MEKDTATLVQALVALLLILGIAMGMVYWVTATSYNKKVETVKSSYSERFNELAKEVTKAESDVAQMKEIRFWCTDCHQVVEKFHSPANITILAESKQRKPRVCVQCHGFSIHTIHENKMQSGQLQCEKCHIVEGKLIKPRPRPGDILVCQQCHYEGNYIDIHINFGKATCLNCHVGGVSNVHKNTAMNAQPELIGKIPPGSINLSVITIVP